MKVSFSQASAALLLSFSLLLPSSHKHVNGLSAPLASAKNMRGFSRRTTTQLQTSADASTVEGDDNVPKLKNKLTSEFFSIGFPAFIQLAAEPLAALVVR